MPQENNTLLNSDLYRPNSNKARSEEKKKELPPPKNVQKVVKGEVKSKEQSMVKRAALGFLADDAEDIKQYILLDVLIPTAKDTLLNVISMILYGDVRGRRSGGYDSMYKKKSGSNVVQSPYRKANRKARHDFRDVKFETRADAMDVLSQLNELIEMYGSATVEDFYISMGEEKQNIKWTDREWGWTSLKGIGVDRALGGGYTIELPRAEKLD